MNLFNYITNDEKEAMKKYIRNYVEHDGSSKNMASLDFIYRFWDENKVNLYNVLGKKFIATKQIKVAKSDIQIRDDMEDLFYKNVAARAFKNNFRNYFEDYCSNNSNLTCSYWDLMSLFEYDYLGRNDYQGSPWCIMTPDNHKIAVIKGCRPVKMLGKIAEAFGIEGYDDFRLAHSLATNQRMLSGTMNISIHPLDFMTMSDNDSGWSSCMSWREAGCYCRGTVETMNSPYVVVAYLDADRPMDVEGLSWSNKKWRQLLIVSHDIIFAIKAYPYYNEELSKAAVKMVADLAKENMSWEYEEPIVIEHHHEFEFKGEKYYCSMSTNTMYNDCGSVKHVIAMNKIVTDEHKYQIETTHDYSNREHIKFKINYSGEEECMWCGTSDGCFDGEGQLACENCVSNTYCDCCGERVSADDLRELDGQYYCECCYEDRAQYDRISDEDHHVDNMTQVYLVPTGYVTDCVDNEETPSFRLGTEEYVWNENLMYRNMWNVSSYFDFSGSDGACPNWRSRDGWGRRYYYITPDMLRPAGRSRLFDSESTRLMDELKESYQAYYNAHPEIAESEAFPGYEN